jgi:hypothetical protein
MTEAKTVEEVAVRRPLTGPAAVLGIAFGTLNGLFDWISPLVLVGIFLVGAIVVARSATELRGRDR